MRAPDDGETITAKLRWSNGATVVTVTGLPEAVRFEFARFDNAGKWRTHLTKELTRGSTELLVELEGVEPAPG